MGTCTSAHPGNQPGHRNTCRPHVWSEQPSPYLSAFQPHRGHEGRVFALERCRHHHDIIARGELPHRHDHILLHITRTSVSHLQPQHRNRLPPSLVAHWPTTKYLQCRVERITHEGQQVWHWQQLGFGLQDWVGSLRLTCWLHGGLLGWPRLRLQLLNKHFTAWPSHMLKCQA